MQHATNAARGREFRIGKCWESTPSVVWRHVVGGDGHAPINHGIERALVMNIKPVLIVTQAAALMSWGALMTIVPATSWADDSKPGAIHTRSIDDIQADQMRNWSAKPSGTQGADVRTRSTEDANADLMRDWNAKPSGTLGPSAVSRSADEAWNDPVHGGYVGGPPAMANVPAAPGAVATKK